MWIISTGYPSMTLFLSELLYVLIKGTLEWIGQLWWLCNDIWFSWQWIVQKWWECWMLMVSVKAMEEKVDDDGGIKSLGKSTKPKDTQEVGTQKVSKLQAWYSPTTMISKVFWMRVFTYNSDIGVLDERGVCGDLALIQPLVAALRELDLKLPVVWLLVDYLDG